MFQSRYLTVFAFVWGMAAVEEKLEKLKFSVSSMDNFFDWLVVGLGIALIFAPRSRKILLGLSIVNLVSFFIELPNVVNHYYVISAINLYIVWSLLKQWGCRESEAVNEFKGLQQGIIALVYLFGAFHKLNSDFFDPKLSCVGYLYDRVQWSWKLLPDLNESFIVAGAWFTVLAETFLGLGLLIKKLRPTALGLGLAFHTFLGVRYPSFSILAYVLYLAVLPSWVYSRIYKYISGQRRTLLVFVVLTSVVVLKFFYEFPGYKVEGQYLYNLTLTTLLGSVYLVTLALYKSQPRQNWNWPSLSRINLLGVLILLLLFVNGMGNYLGLKTTTTFSMYSNLQTETKSNHFILDNGQLEIFDYQSELFPVYLYEPLATGQKFYLQYHLPLIEIVRRTDQNNFWTAPKERLYTKLLNQYVPVIEIEKKAPFRDFNIIEKKFLSFRKVDLRNWGQCSW